MERAAVQFLKRLDPKPQYTIQPHGQSKYSGLCFLILLAPLVISIALSTGTFGSTYQPQELVCFCRLPTASNEVISALQSLATWHSDIDLILLKQWSRALYNRLVVGRDTDPAGYRSFLPGAEVPFVRGSGDFSFQIIPISCPDLVVGQRCSESPTCTILSWSYSVFNSLQSLSLTNSTCPMASMFPNSPTNPYPVSNAGFCTPVASSSSTAVGNLCSSLGVTSVMSSIGGTLAIFAFLAYFAGIAARKICAKLLSNNQHKKDDEESQSVPLETPLLTKKSLLISGLNGFAISTILSLFGYIYTIWNHTFSRHDEMKRIATRFGAHLSAIAQLSLFQRLLEQQISIISHGVHSVTTFNDAAGTSSTTLVGGPIASLDMPQTFAVLGLFNMVLLSAQYIILYAACRDAFRLFPVPSIKSPVLRIILILLAISGSLTAGPYFGLFLSSNIYNYTKTSSLFINLLLLLVCYVISILFICGATLLVPSEWLSRPSQDRSPFSSFIAAFIVCISLFLSWLFSVSSMYIYSTPGVDTDATSSQSTALAGMALQSICLGVALVLGFTNYWSKYEHFLYPSAFIGYSLSIPIIIASNPSHDSGSFAIPITTWFIQPLLLCILCLLSASSNTPFISFDDMGYDAIEDKNIGNINKETAQFQVGATALSLM